MFRGERRANAEPSHQFPTPANMAVGIDCRPMTPVPLHRLPALKRPRKTRRTNEAIMIGTQASAAGADFAAFAPKHFGWRLDGKVATITLDRPERKNPLTFASYAELRDTFRALARAREVKAIVITGADGNFCSGGDVHEIIAGVDGGCAGAGAILAMAADLRYGTARSRVAFLFVRVGLAGADMGACNILPRIVGAGRAAELLYTGRAMDGNEAERWGFYNRLCPPERVLAEAQEMAASLAAGPTFAH